MTRLGSMVVVVTTVALTIGCGPNDTSKRDSPKRGDPNGTGGVAPVPLIALLEELPKDHWPKDNNDNLWVARANEWYDNNAAGRRVTWTVPKDHNLSLALDRNSRKYSVIFAPVTNTVKPFGVNYPLKLGELRVDGLTESAAERLRAMPVDQPLELVLTISGIQFDREATVTVKDNVAIKALSE